MRTKKLKDKQSKIPDSDNQNESESINKIKVVYYPEPSASKPGYIENPDIPWIQSPQTNEQPNDFVVALVHEMRNPLAVICLSAELIIDLTHNDDDLKVCLDTIKKSTLKINDLIFRLLAVQQLTEATENPCSVVTIFDEVLETVADRIRLKSITVIKDFYAAESLLALDKSKLKIAFINIIMNAIDAMPLVNGILRLAIKENNGKYSVRIEDNGCGISKENLQSIFKRGFTNKPNGSGYGLSITTNFLQANNVAMKVKSEEGKGTIFLLLFN